VTRTCASTETLAGDLRRVAAILADRIPYALLVCDRAGAVLTANAAAEDLCGRTREEMLGQPLATCGLFPEASVGRWLDRFSAEPEGWTEDVSLVRAAGPCGGEASVAPLRWGTDPAFAFAVAVRSSGARPAPRPFRFSDGCAAVGRYASTVSHDLRNPLTGISTGVQYLRRTLGRDSKHGETLDLILAEVRNLNDAITRLASVRHRAEFRPGVCAAADLLGEALACRGEDLRAKDLRPSVRLDPMLPGLWVDRNQTVAALSAFVERAAAAAVRGSVLHITGRGAVDGPPAWRQAEPAEYAVIEVRCETEAEDLREYVEAFDPTSPAAEAQTALFLAGQAIAAGGGFVDLSGTPGRSLMFAIALPASRA
jgi:nitrogen-specific signal transduction histidine kinase